jgi:uncharacterized protein YndB with AHSA1/START domain
VCSPRRVAGRCAWNAIYLTHPNASWAALTKADQVRQWAPYVPARDLDLVGDVLLPQAEGGEPAEELSEPGQVVEAQRPRLLVLLWGGHIVRYELTPTSSGHVRLVLTHTSINARRHRIMRPAGTCA